MSEAAATSPNGPSPTDGCLTEAELAAMLPPIPQWMREAPSTPREPRLFD